MRTWYRSAVESVRDWLQAKEPGPAGPATPAVLAVYACILFAAFGLRAHFAGMAYPAQQDSVHLIQAGVQWANGVPGRFSGIHQEFPVLVSGIAYKLGLNPAKALQWTMCLLGTLLVGMTMLLATRLFDRHRAGWLAGLWSAANPGLLNYSVNSMPEIGFAACLLGAYSITAGALRGGPVRYGRTLVSFALIGAGIYLKPLDSLTAMALIAGWILLINITGLRKVVLPVGAGLLLFAAVIYPHHYLQSLAPAENSLGVGMINRAGGIVKGLKAHESRYEYASALDSDYARSIEELRRQGIAGWIWHNRVDISRRYLLNLMRAIRTYGDYLFTNAFRVGNAWFIAMIASIILVGIASPRRRQVVFLALAVSAFPLGVSLGYIFERWLIIYVPLFIVLIAGHLVHTASLWDLRWKRIAWLLLLFVMMGNSVKAVQQQLKDEAWFWDNQKSVAVWLRDVARNGERIMSGKPTLMLETDLVRPERWAQLTPASVERVEELAALGNISFIVLSDDFYPHWPINQLLKDAPAPGNWTNLGDRVFMRDHPVWGPQRNMYRIYRRTDPRAAE
jgi:hypothetical protein